MNLKKKKDILKYIPIKKIPINKNLKYLFFCFIVSKDKIQSKNLRVPSVGEATSRIWIAAVKRWKHF